MAYGKRSPLPKLKNTNAIDDVKSALQKKDIKITGAMGSELRANQYKEKGWAMDNTIGSAQGGTYKKPTVPTGKFGSDLRRKEYEANNWGGDATTKGNMPGSSTKSTDTNTGGGKNTGGGGLNNGGGLNTGGGKNTGGNNTGGGMNTGGDVNTGGNTIAGGSASTGGETDKTQSLQDIVDSGKYKFDGNNNIISQKPAAQTFAERAGSTYKFKNAMESARNTANSAVSSFGSRTASDIASSGSGIIDTTREKVGERVREGRIDKYSTLGKSGKQLRRSKQANKYNTLAKKAFKSGDSQEANRLIREEAYVSRKIKNTDERRERKRKRKLEKAQAKVKKYTK